MRKILFSLLILGLLTAVGLSQPLSALAAKKIVIRISHTGAADNEFSQGYEKFKELVEAKSDGRVEIKIFPNAVLGSDRVAGEAVQQGNLEVVSIATNIMSSFTKAALAFDMPYVCEEAKMDSYMRALAYGELGEYLSEQLGKVGLVPFMYNATAMRSYVYTKKDVKSLADMKGVKIRATPSPIDVANAKAVGMNPTALAFDAVYQALQQGTVDGELLSFTSMMSFDRAEIIKYMLVSKHNFPIHIGCMNKKFYDALPEDIKQIIHESAKEAQEYEWAIMQKLEADGLEYCRKNGVTVNFMTPEQQAELKQAFQKVWDEFMPQLDPKMVELISAAQK
ncbi:TRAP transporter substrate-binding protein [Desulfovibrio sp. OttesenSCG-928-C06]|nr:TRAP transporter substrate-binding protein [Desulfovibrio sp. OttesenSCG-928-C06]